MSLTSYRAIQYHLFDFIYLFLHNNKQQYLVCQKTCQSEANFINFW